jgi:hypothetical protein
MTPWAPTRAARRRRALWTRALACLVCAAGAPPAAAHNGPPYPIVSNQAAGPYRISVWTDPDATDDGSRGGQFWVLIDPLDSNELGQDLRARVSIRPLDERGSAASIPTEPVDGNRSRQFAALLMDHEGPFAVRVEVESAAGRGAVDSRVEATYDLRPPRIMLAIYAVPFVLVGLLWAKRLARRRRAQAARRSLT